MEDYIKGFGDFVNEDANNIYSSLIMDEARWLKDSRASFENAMEDDEIEPSLEEYHWNKYKEASLAAWHKITKWIDDSTPVFLELNVNSMLPDRSRHQRFHGIENLVKELELMLEKTDSFSQWIEVTDMLETEPALIPVLTLLRGEKLALMVENPDPDFQMYGTAYAIVPKRMIDNYVAPGIN